MKKFLLTTLCLLGLSTAASAAIYSKVTDASTLKAGDKIIVVGAVQKDGKDKAMAIYTSGNNCKSIEVTIADDKIANPEATVAVITLETGSASGKWALKTSAGYLYAANSSTGSNNYLKAKTAAVDWTIAIETGTAYATMTSDGGNEHNILRYNSSNDLFSCYASGSQQNIYIFREEAVTEPTIVASPSAVDFGSILVDATPEAQSITITGLNLTETPVVEWTDPADNIFSYSGSLTTDGGTLTISITSTATAGTYAKTLHISANGTSVDVNVSAKIFVLAGTGEGTLASPYDVARALCIIENNLYDASTEYYVKGVITGTPTINIVSGLATYDIKDAGIDGNLYIYCGYYNNDPDPAAQKFTSTTQIKEGDEVVVCGKMKVFNSTPELDAYNYIVTLNGESTLPTTKATTIELANTVLSLVMGTPQANAATVKCEGEAVAGAVVTYTIDLATVATVDANTGMVTPVAPGIATVTVNYAGDEDYRESSATYTVTVSDKAGAANGTYYFGPDWNALFGTNYEGSISSVKQNSLSLSGTVEGIAMEINNNTSTSGYVKLGDLRLYKGSGDGTGYVMTITAPTNYNITTISSTVGGKTFSSGLTADTGELIIDSNAISWTGSSNSVVLTASGTVSFATICVQLTDVPTALDTVGTDETDAAPEYYNLQGIRVNADAKGLIIVKKGNRVSKQIR